MWMTKFFKHKCVHVRKNCSQSLINVVWYLYSHVWFVAMFVRLWLDIFCKKFDKWTSLVSGIKEAETGTSQVYREMV